MRRIAAGRVEWLLLAAALGMVGGAAAVIRAATYARRTGVYIQRIQADFTRVLDAEQRMLNAEALVNAVRATGGGEPRAESPAAILRRLSPELPAEFTDPVIVADTPAGRVVRVEWSIDDTAAEPVFLFAAVCERQRPPWRVESMRLQAVPGRPGRVRGGITFIGLDASLPEGTR